MIVRIAAGLARSSAPEHRWRRVAVPLASAIAMLLFFTATSVVAVVQREADRVEARTALIASAAAATDLILVERDDSWRGEQFGVVWIEPSGSEPPVLPPGVDELPAPGEAVVSPALERAISRDAGLAARYPNRRLLGNEGIRSRGELLAYARPPAGRALAGEAAALRVRAFGRPSAGQPAFSIGPSLPPPVLPIVEAVLALLVAPALLVLALGVATASTVRDHRFQILRWLGARARTSIALGVLETMMLAIPGLLATGVVWALLPPRLDRVPLVGHEVLRGDLALPWWLLVAELAGAAALTGALAAAVTGVRARRGRAGPRPTREPTGVTPLRVVPFALACAAFVLGAASDGHRAGALMLAGVGLALAGLPLVLPSVLGPVASAVGQLESVPALIAARRLEWDPVRTARPFVACGILVVIALTASGYLALLREVEPERAARTGSHGVVVNWLAARPEDRERLRSALPGTLVAPLRALDDTFTVGASCRDVARYLPGTECRPNAPFELPPQASQALAALAGLPGQPVELAPPAAGFDEGTVLVVDDAPLASLDERVRVAAMRLLPAPTVASELTFVQRESPLVAWLIGGIAAAFLALAIGSVLSLVDRLLAARKDHRHLVNLGLTPRRLVNLEVWQFAAPYTAIVAASFAAGLAMCVLILRLGGAVPMPWEAIAATVAGAAVVGLVGTAGVALFGVTSVRDTARDA